MLIKSLRLKNIRSYAEQSVDFSEDSTLLSGDIGSGKSTLLLAVEFALFGISKPGLTGETLLRKGATSAAVELNFQLDDKDIVIQRNLKKSRKSINQTSGSLTINNLKKEMTPVELKAEIINLLNYPEDQISKSKNYIFRYTIYCPQEEMKQILQDAPENRLDILRKIFNLDKYQRVRDNLQLFLKQVRFRSAVIRTKTEPLGQKKIQLEEVRKKLEDSKISLSRLVLELDRSKKDIQKKKDELLESENKNKKYLQLRNQLANLQSLMTEKQKQQALFLQRKEQAEKNILSLSVENTREELEKKLKVLQKQQQDFIAQESEIKAGINHCQESVALIQEEISRLAGQVYLVPEKEKDIRSLDQELSQKEEHQKRKEKLEEEFNSLRQKIDQQQLFLSQSREVVDKVSQLEHCPTCLQSVPEEHRNQVLGTQQQKQESAKKEIAGLENKKEIFQKSISELNQILDVLSRKERLAAKLQAELSGLKEKEILVKEKKDKLRETVKENNRLIKELERFQPGELAELNRQLSEIQEFLQKIIQQEELKRTLKDALEYLKQLETEISDLSRQKEILEKEILQYPEMTEKIDQQKRLLEDQSEKEKNLFSEKTRLDTMIENFQQQAGSLVEEVDQLNRLRSHQIRLNETHHWLENFLVKLTYTIEKQVMIKIYQLFNQLFQEWFSVLIEDENFSARLDDAFTPVIEQDGYEILFDNLSGGERTAASLSYRLALNKVINDIVHEIRTKDLLILDEPTDGFSSEQLDKVRDVLEKLGLRQTLIVSHESKIESFVDHVIRIGKEGGISRIFD